MYIIKRSLALLVLGIMTLHVAAQGTPEEDYGPQATKTDAARKLDKKHAKKYKDNKDVLVLPGLVANKKTKTVEILAESTGLGTEEAVEFLLVHATSTQGYESLLWLHAKPSDIHKALEFIGVPGGAPHNPNALRFWPKGELIKASITKDGTEGVPLEELIYDKDAEKAMEDQSFLFTGSIKVPDPKDDKKEIYFADMYQPRAILPGFNSSMGVLEPMWQASKGEAYQTHVVNPDYAFTAHELMTLVLEPVSKDGDWRVLNLNMTIEDRETFKVADAKNKPLTKDTTIKAALEVCLGYLKKGKFPYVTLKFSDKLRLLEIRQLCAAMAMLDQPNALRIEPPLPGRLYYRSFLTSPSWRDQTKRMNQSWELHIARKDGKLTGTMIFHDMIWKEGTTKPDFKTRTYSTPTAKDVRKRLDDDVVERDKANKVMLQPVLMVFAPADLVYGELLKFLGPALKTHKTVHLFLESPAPAP